MSKSISTFAVAAWLILAGSGAAAAPVNKCMVNGTVTYQRDPCPSDAVRKAPTAQELNAEQKRRREAAKAGGKAASATAAAADSPQKSARAEPAVVKPVGFRCDGRQYCSQMRSCDEAKYFLANCPGVKMDGDRDGVPCEDQWCSR